MIQRALCAWVFHRAARKYPTSSLEFSPTWRATSIASHWFAESIGRAHVNTCQSIGLNRRECQSMERCHNHGLSGRSLSGDGATDKSHLQRSPCESIIVTRTVRLENEIGEWLGGEEFSRLIITRLACRQRSGMRANHRMNILTVHSENPIVHVHLSTSWAAFASVSRLNRVTKLDWWMIVEHVSYRSRH